jgi:hypothetical protein
MSQNLMTRKVIRLAMGLLIAAVVITTLCFDAKTAAGVLGGGLLMLGSFLFGAWTVSKMGQPGVSQGAAGLVVLKLPILGLALWALMQRFDAIAVVAGGSLLMVSIFISAFIEQLHLVRKEA